MNNALYFKIDLLNDIIRKLNKMSHSSSTVEGVLQFLKQHNNTFEGVLGIVLADMDE